MRIEVVNSGRTLRFSGLDRLLAQIVCTAPEMARNGTTEPRARKRLFPEPSRDQTINKEWEEFIQPGLESLFLSAADQVASDLAQHAVLEPDDDGVCSFDVPLDHVDAWLACLNTARLSLAALHGFSDQELAGSSPTDVKSLRELALLQIHFYAVLQECLLAQADPEA